MQIAINLSEFLQTENQLNFAHGLIPTDESPTESGIFLS